MKPRLVAMLVVIGLAGGQPASATTPGATLRFATACAHCHEGECSGRLSFALRPEAAFDHIRQYAGPTDDDLALQLHATLERMKADCSYPPLRAPELDGPLNAADLEPYRDAWTGDYFVPLDGLEAGLHELVVEFDGSGQLRVELIDAGFDPLVDRCLTIDAGRLVLAIELESSTRHYLRLRPRGPLRATGLIVGAVR